MGTSWNKSGNKQTVGGSSNKSWMKSTKHKAPNRGGKKGKNVNVSKGRSY